MYTTDKNLLKVSECIQKMCSSDADRQFAMKWVGSVFSMVVKYKEVEELSVKIKDIQKSKTQIDPIILILPVMTKLLMNKSLRKDVAGSLAIVITYVKNKSEQDTIKMLECMIQNCGLTIGQVKCIYEFIIATIDFTSDPVLIKPMKQLSETALQMHKKTLKLLLNMEAKQKNSGKAIKTLKK